MAPTGKSEVSKYGLLSAAIAVLGITLASTPAIPDNYKKMLILPFFAACFYTYYKYLNLRRTAKENTAARESENRAARRQAERMQKEKK